MSYRANMAKTFLDAQDRFKGLPAFGLITSKVHDFVRNPTDPRFRLERMEGAKNGWWKFRIDNDLRVIVAQVEGEFVLCYVDLHDDAYDWAGRRRFDVNDRTGEVQIIEVKEEIEIHTIVRREEQAPPFFEKWEDGYLLDLGVPQEYLYALNMVNDDDGMMELINVLPEEVAQRLLDLNDGKLVPRPVRIEDVPTALQSQLCFATIESEMELRQALGSPMEKWIIFIHPTQRKIAAANFEGAACVTGSAGTGKSVVALHRAVNLATSNKKVLLTTLTTTMVEEFKHKLSLELGKDSDIRDRIDARNIHQVARSIISDMKRHVKNQVNDSFVRELIEESAGALGNRKIPLPFLISEWEALVDPWAIKTWEQYEKASRSGRGTPLQAKQKAAVWQIFDDVLRKLAERGVVTHNQLLQEAADLLNENEHTAYESIVADEAQDLSPAALRLLRALVKPAPNDLFMCRDAGQSIYGSQFSLKDVGIDVRGRSKRLRRNYRTTRQIQAFAEALLPDAIMDGDGVSERREAVSILAGPKPLVQVFPNQNKEIEYVANHLTTLINNGAQLNEIAIFGRDAVLRERAESALTKCNLDWHYLKDGLLPSMNRVSLSTMHRARGLEFRIVVVMGCDADLLPHTYVLEKQYDDLDREYFIEQERHALYVACTRARENLLVTCSGNPSVFLEPVCAG